MKRCCHLPLLLLLLLICGINYQGFSQTIPARVLSLSDPTNGQTDNQTPISPLQHVLIDQLKIKDSIHLELFVMSHCPFGVRAEQTILPMLSLWGKRIKLSLYYIGDTDVYGQVQSMHGQAEVEEDFRQLVIGRLYPERLYEYLLTRAESYQSPDWKAIATRMGIAPDAVEKMMNSIEGKKMFAENIQVSVERKIYASPTLLIDGRHYQGRIMPLTVANVQCHATPAAVKSKINDSDDISALQPVVTASYASELTGDCTGMSDGTACHGTDACMTGTCQNEICEANTPVVCNDNNLCTNDACEPNTGKCIFQFKTCNDNNSCTIDRCDPIIGCINTSKIVMMIMPVPMIIAMLAQATAQIHLKYATITIGVQWMHVVQNQAVRILLKNAMIIILKQRIIATFN